MSAIVAIDLRRDLPKVRKHIALVRQAHLSRGCNYTAPCVIGAMVPPKKRGLLESADTEAGDSTILSLVSEGFVSVPAEQVRDVSALQTAFDYHGWTEFQRTLRRIEKKYLPAQEKSK